MHKAILFLFLIALAGAATAASAEPISSKDRDFAVQYLEKTKKEFLESVQGLSEAQWRFKPAPGVWSIAECAEHITLSEDSVFQLSMDALKKPAAPEKKTEVAGKDERVIQIITDRSKKATAPSFLRPSNRWKTKEELLAYFEKSRDSHIHYLQTTSDDLRGHLGWDEDVGAIDAYQFLLLMAAHSSRHTMQILEVKQNPNFPRE
jgi:hypothetical protein